MKPIIVIFGIVVAAFGGVISYRALFLEPSAAVVITNTEIRELPNYTRVVGRNRAGDRRRSHRFLHGD